MKFVVKEIAVKFVVKEIAAKFVVKSGDVGNLSNLRFLLRLPVPFQKVGTSLP